jgi:hypothetical protein
MNDHTKDAPELAAAASSPLHRSFCVGTTNNYCSVMPKSQHCERLASIDIFDFELTADDMAAM